MSVTTVNQPTNPTSAASTTSPTSPTSPTSTTSTPVSAFDVTMEQKESFLFEVAFDHPDHDPVFLDEPAPLGKNAAPNAARLLAAAIGNCLSASLVFCVQKNGGTLQCVKTRVHVDIVRNEHKRLRIGRVGVQIVTPAGADPTTLAKCLPVFEDFCTVTASIRQGIAVDVAVTSA
jgi:uncharacterized OsmC-like protein